MSWRRRNDPIEEFLRNLPDEIIGIVFLALLAGFLILILEGSFTNLKEGSSPDINKTLNEIEEKGKSLPELIFSFPDLTSLFLLFAFAIALYILLRAPRQNGL